MLRVLVLVSAGVIRRVECKQAIRVVSVNVYFKDQTARLEAH